MSSGTAAREGVLHAATGARTRRPQLHEAAMLLASLSILAGATVRMPVLFPVFGEAGCFRSVHIAGENHTVDRTRLIMPASRD